MAVAIVLLGIVAVVFFWNNQKKPTVISELLVPTNSFSAQQLTLPGLIKESSVGILDGSIYYTGMHGKTPCVYRAKEGNPTESSIVYRFESWADPYSTYPVPVVGFIKKDGQVYMIYHTGGATMGSDNVVRINPNGTAQEVVSGHQTFAMDGQNMVVAQQFVPPAPMSMEYWKAGTKVASIGSPDYYYGWIMQGGDGTISGGPADYMEVKKGWVYINASKEVGTNYQNFMWRINISNSIMQQLTRIPMKSFEVKGDNVYFLGASNSKLYQGNLDGRAESVLVDEAVESYEVDSNTVRYIAARDHELYRRAPNDSAKSVLKGTKVQSIARCNHEVFAISQSNRLFCIRETQEPVAVMPKNNIENITIQGDYVIATLSLGEDKKQLAVCNPAGEVLLKTQTGAYDDYSMQISGNILYFKSNKTAHFYKVDLNSLKQ